MHTDSFTKAPGAARLGLWAGIGALSLALGCSGSVSTTVSAGSSGDPGGSGGASTTTTAGAGGSGGGSGSGGAEGLGGHFMQRTIGNCIDYEEWLTFSPPAGVVETIVDRDACAPHSITSRAGTYDGPNSDQRLVLDWKEPGRYAYRSFTADLVDPYPYPLLSPPPGSGSYKQGSGALNVMGYFQSGAEPSYVREDRFVHAPDNQNKKHTKYVWVFVTFQQPLQIPASPAACTMEVTVDARIYLDVPPDPKAPPDDAGQFTTSLPCTYALDTAVPWVRVTGDGFEQSQNDGSWRDYLENTFGLSAMYSGEVVSALEEAFRPILYFEPTNTRMLFHDVWFAWYIAMQSPPPTSPD